MSDLKTTLAFVFPGQGSQSVGMLRGLHDHYPEIIAQTLGEAADVLKFDLWRVICDGPAEVLDSTENTQPAMLAAGVAVWRAWRHENGLRPAWMAGHSLGEYTALVCAGRLAFADAVALVHARGRLMQGAVPKGTGAMAAILGLDSEVVVELCERISTDQALVAAANFNSPGQIVIAGHADAVNRAIDAAKEAGAKRALLLPVSVPSHCALMNAAAAQLGTALASIRIDPSEIQVVQNADVRVHLETEAVRGALVRQLSDPVRWTETVSFIRDQGVTQFVECGPGKVLSGLIKRIVPDCSVLSVQDGESISKALEAIS